MSIINSLLVIVKRIALLTILSLLLFSSQSIQAIQPIITGSTPNNEIVVELKRPNPGSMLFHSELTPQDTGDPFVFKFLTYNIEITGILDPEDLWRDVLVEENADVVQMGETGAWKTVDDEDFVTHLNYINSKFEEKGLEPYKYTALSREATSTGGATTLSRYPILETYQIDSYTLDNGTMSKFNHDLHHAVIEINGTEIHFIGSVHFLCCGYDTAARIRDVEASLNYIDDQGEVPFIFNGDFNGATPEDIGKFPDMATNIDPEPLGIIVDPDDPRSAKKHHFIDVYRTLNPTIPGFTYMSDRFKSRLDYIYVNEFFFDKIINSTAGGTKSSSYGIERGSDHLPVDVTINMQPEVADLRPPFEVHNVGAEINTPTNITLSWAQNAANDTDYYNVFRDDQKLVSTNATSAFDDTIHANKIHKFEVNAVDSNGNTGRRSFPLYYNSSYGVLSVPSAPVLTVEELEGKIRLTWSVADDGGSPITDYLVLRGTERSIKLEDETQHYFPKGRTTSTEYVDELGRLDTIYYYKVIAFNMLGESMESNIVEAKSLLVSSDGETKLFSLVLPLTLIAIIPLLKRRNNNL